MDVVATVHGVFLRGAHGQFRWQCKGCLRQAWGPPAQSKDDAAAGALAHAKTVHGGWAPAGPARIGQPMAYAGRQG